MPYLKGTATDMRDLVQQVITWCTDSSIHGQDVWELMRNDPWPRGAILKAHGWGEGEHQYIGMMFADIVKGQSYKNWLSQEEVFSHEFVFNKNGANVKHGEPITINGLSVTAGGMTYSINAPEVFAKSAKVVFFGVFKQYSDGLNWDELPGSDRDFISPLPLTYSVTGSEDPAFFNPPRYPGTGFPAIGCDYEGFINEKANFWVTKDRHRMTIVINDNVYWDAVNVGFLEPYHKPTDYSFPAVVVGGTSGVLPSVYVWTPRGAKCPSMIFGYLLDYKITNWSLSHGNAAFAATIWDGSASWENSKAISQVQLMLPDGVWQSFSNWGIRKDVITEDSGGGCPICHFVNNEPEKPKGLQNYIRPTFTDLSGTLNIYDSSNSDREIHQLEPLELVQGENPITSNMFGSIWRMYWASSKFYKYGEQIINGKKHLVIPNGWEGRKFDIPHGISRITDVKQLLDLQNRIENMSNTMNCIIQLED